MTLAETVLVVGIAAAVITLLFVIAGRLHTLHLDNQRSEQNRMGERQLDTVGRMLGMMNTPPPHPAHAAQDPGMSGHVLRIPPEVIRYFFGEEEKPERPPEAQGNGSYL
jgi:hypothetical protein